jgi:cysteine-rich repeat protein
MTAAMLLNYNSFRTKRIIMLLNRHSVMGLVILTTTLGSCSSSTKAHTPDAGLDGNSLSDPVSTSDSGTEAAQLPDASVVLDAQAQDLYRVDAQVDSNPVDVACPPGSLSNANNTCVPLPGCNGKPLLGCTCDLPGDTACNSAVRPNKVPLVCQGGLWILNGGRCSSTQNCDWKDGLCKPIANACAGLKPGDAFCDYSSEITAYKDVRMVCGGDLVDVNATDNPCVGTCGGTPAVCQAATCGDGKVETGEACDDGNAVPLDGCEPVTCSKSKVLKLAVGDGHSCALCEGGYVRCWGNNVDGQLGLGHKLFEGDRHPYQILNAANGPNIVDFDGVAAIDIAAGSGFTCVILTGGIVRCWGQNDTGQLGKNNTIDMAGRVGTEINLDSGVTANAISANLGYACAALSNGTVRCWGDNSNGLLGLGNTSAVLSGTVALESGTVVVGVATSPSHACVLASGGAVHCWGDNFEGEFGLGSTTPKNTDSALPSSYGDASLMSGRIAIRISLGDSFNCFSLDDGELECWGYNGAGQLGLGNTQTVGDNEVLGSTSIVPTGTTAVLQVVNGASHTCVLYAGNAGVKCWGANENAELGYGDINRRGDTSSTIPALLPPVSLPSGLTATAVYAGTADTCVLLSDGSVRCWGWNDRGQLGLGKVSGVQLGTPDYIGGSPTEIPSLLPALKIFGP